MANDFNAAESWFSLNGHVPISWHEFPERIRLSDGSTRTDKSTFTEAQLNSAGYKIGRWVNYNDETHHKIWNGTTFEILEFNIKEDLDDLPDPEE